MTTFSRGSHHWLGVKEEIWVRIRHGRADGGTSRKSGGKGFWGSGTSPFFQVSVSMIKEMREGPKNLVDSARHLAPNSHGNNSEKQLELPRKEEEGEML